MRQRQKKIMIAKKKVSGRKRREAQKLAEKRDQQSEGLFRREKKGKGVD